MARIFEVARVRANTKFDASTASMAGDNIDPADIDPVGVDHFR
jgi:hypothetical protein